MIKKVIFILLLLFISSFFIISNEKKSNLTDQEKNNISRHLRNASIGLMIPSPTIVSFSFVFFGLGDLSDIECRFYDEYGFLYTAENWGWNDLNRNTWNDYKVVAYSLGGSLLGLGLVLNITSIILLGSSIAIEKKINNSNDSFKKPISLWKVFLINSLFNSIPIFIIHWANIFIIHKLYVSRRFHEFYRRNENLGINYFTGSVISCSIYEVISVVYLLFSLFTNIKEQKNKVVKNISPIFNLDNNNTICIGLNVKL